MDRIVCGDVGFGKTEVAIRAAFRVATSGRQVAVLCPTTVLAQQHASTFTERLRDYPLRVEVLSRFVDKQRQSEVLAATKEGKVDILVGTHRLLSKDVHFASLGLLVVDEEQRFGVTHKERIKKLRSEVDVLTLTATPIPRHAAARGRRPARPLAHHHAAGGSPRGAHPSSRAGTTTSCARPSCASSLRGGQVFFVYNRIEGFYERAHRLAGARARGRASRWRTASSREGTLERTMTDFVDGAYDVLCSTAIIRAASTSSAPTR
ncbi:MAG: DEAD/DEAH box helicase [Sandaracinaceae bacterium]|nr:DEAD/DEAH box helicase [Sandaracinaceae bacterium]